MNQSNAATLVAGRVAEEEASPPAPASAPPRRRLLLVLAVLALAGTLISLASLRLAESAPAQRVGVDDKAATGLLPGDLSGVVPDLGNAVPALPVPAVP